LIFILQSLIYVSTVYSNYPEKHIGEHFCTYSINPKDIITFARTLSENEMKKKINTYVFTSFYVKYST